MNRSKKGSRNLVIFTLVIVALLLALFLLDRATSDSNDGKAADSAPDISGQPLMGNQDAKVTIVEFGDYKCPSCKAWGAQVMPKLEETYISTGKAKFAYVNVLFHGAESTLGALAAESVFSQNPEAYWAFHKGLFDAQPAEDHDALWITPEKVLEIAKEHAPDVDAAKLEADMNTIDPLPQITTDQALVEQYKVQQTPTIMINDVVVSNPFDYEAITKIIEEQLEG